MATVESNNDDKDTAREDIWDEETETLQTVNTIGQHHIRLGKELLEMMGHTVLDTSYGMLKIKKETAYNSKSLAPAEVYFMNSVNTYIFNKNSNPKDMCVQKINIRTFPIANRTDFEAGEVKCGRTPYLPVKPFGEMKNIPEDKEEQSRADALKAAPFRPI